MNQPKSVKRVAKWHCGFCGERFVWADVDVDDREWIGTIRLIQSNHFEKCPHSSVTKAIDDV